MQIKSFARALAFLAVVALAIPALAKPVSKSISLGKAARIGTVQLEAGDYQLLVDGTNVTLKKGKATVAQVEGQWEQRENKSPYNSVLIGPNGQVQEIRFRDDRRVLVIRAD